MATVQIQASCSSPKEPNRIPSLVNTCTCLLQPAVTRYSPSGKNPTHRGSKSKREGKSFINRSLLGLFRSTHSMAAPSRSVVRPNCRTKGTLTSRPHTKCRRDRQQEDSKKRRISDCFPVFRFETFPRPLCSGWRRPRWKDPGRGIDPRRRLYTLKRVLLSLR